MDAWEYRGRWALVTGASAGIGAAFARALARRGMSVVLAARRADRLRALAAELERAHGVEAIALPADLGKPGAAGVLWAEAAAEGRGLHLLVNNAGFGLKGRFDELPLERQAEMVRVNCIAPLELAHLALRHLRPRGAGGIVNVASIAGYQPIPLLAAYAASKAFLVALSEALADECRGSGVRVVTLSPGAVATEFQGVAGTRVSGKTLGIRSPEQVVEAALRALERGGGSVVPGLANRLGAVAGRLGPRSFVMRAAKAVMTRLR
ncbi:MAG TPA: SDR family oxidoreductase [Longimicrobiaceae bacterium]|nr:SDR family oxidoreductase [Longimicrobiaceae bacterium]